MDTVWGNTNKLFFKVNPSLKFLLVSSLFILYLFVTNLNTMIWTALLFFILYFFVSGLSGKWSFWFVLLTLIVSLFSASAMIFFGKGSSVLFQKGLILITRESLARGVLLGLRTFTFSLIGMVFATTTQPVPFFYSLMQQLKVPARYAYGFMAAFRMIPMMAEEFVKIRQAMRVRGMNRQKGVKAFCERMTRYCLSMLAQSIRRAQRTAIAMEAKRFSMTAERTYYYKISWSRKDIYFVLIVLCTVTLGFVLSNVLPITPYTNVLDH
ncbi:energy-coupling factor transporter transmembrane component T family protein [Sporolactobacillus terrae]|uniref:Energy-coupling factor transporter transmembrane protein EcfT n=1 Tax=Sporolactobacillus terrae TaxID=269673 RepID=A0ABX5Q7E6_9BACL|nr:energy-coupling factor transporter transmembrane component T [Sporolactobacillus terrae]QAA22546.1 energy-coupling factor transporter transmembrane protein EcfT [Sporolactobacillus terrae]QAA25520.1 energy-coupling factor transporter transmembrane protein EcfT [Sporolactobacillus terrae]UAK17330.1 energy-coupling factor transporter transmembrane protein EcfT [Sporolactobacillus terrae]